ncbi:MAG: DNA polymerase III subunit beta [Endomicrobia bacterium]|nr:DNA polymerase III subunit beta [Endomicrobiia bacterium]
MELILERENFLKGLQLLDPIVSAHTSVPITPDVLITTEGKDKCILTGTDIETALSVQIKCKLSTAGEICIPAKKLYSAVKELDEEEIKIKTQDEKTPIAQLFCGKTKHTFIGEPAKNHPGMPKYDEKQYKTSQVTVPTELLLEAFTRTVFATSKEETRYYLNGVYVTIQKDVIKFVATDGRRLAYVIKEISTSKAVCSGIIPTKSVERVIHILEKTSSDSCKFALLPEHFVFEIDDICFVSRLVQGEFPAYEQVIPKISNNLSVSVKKLAKGLKQTSWVTGEKGYGVKLYISSGGIKLSSTVESIGIAEVEIDANYSGKDVEVKFEPSYILEMLSVIDENSDVIIGINEPTSPWTFQPANDKSYLYILMPMKL